MQGQAGSIGHKLRTVPCCGERTEEGQDACKGPLVVLHAELLSSFFTQVVSLGGLVPPGKAKTVYCHLACVLWVPEVELAAPDRMAGVRLDKLTTQRLGLRCELCKQAGGGSV